MKLIFFSFFSKLNIEFEDRVGRREGQSGSWIVALCRLLIDNTKHSERESFTWLESMRHLCNCELQRARRGRREFQPGNLSSSLQLDRGEWKKAYKKCLPTTRARNPREAPICSVRRSASTFIELSFSIAFRNSVDWPASIYVMISTDKKNIAISTVQSNFLRKRFYIMIKIKNI